MNAVVSRLAKSLSYDSCDNSEKALIWHRSGIDRHAVVETGNVAKGCVRKSFDREGRRVK